MKESVRRLKTVSPILPSEHNNPPFVNQWELEQKRRKQLEALAKKKEEIEPSNLDLIALQKNFELALPITMEGKQRDVREFILYQLMPISLSLQNGALDALDVAKRALNDDIQADGLTRTLKSLIVDSLNLKLLSFVTKIAELNPEEAKLLLASYLLRTSTAIGGNQNVIEQILSSLRQFPDVQRPTEERNVPVRKVHTAKERGQPSGPVRRTAGADATEAPAARYSNRNKHRRSRGTVG